VRSQPTAGQATIEYVAAISLLAAVLAVAGPAVGAPSIAHALVAQIKHALCLVGGDFCTPSDARRAGLAPCPLRSDVSGGEGSVTAFSIELGGRTTLTVTPLSDGTVSVVRLAGVSAAAVGGPSVGLSLGLAGVEGGVEGEARRRLQGALGWVFPDRMTADRFLEHALRSSIDRERWPPAWVAGELGSEAGAWAGVSVGAVDKAGFVPVSASGAVNQTYGVKRSRDGSVTFYSRVSLEGPELNVPLLPPMLTRGRNEWVVEYTRKDGEPRELLLRTIAPGDRGHRMTEIVARLDLRNATNREIAGPFLRNPLTWKSAGGVGKQALMNRIATHGTVERAVSEVDDDSRGAAFSIKLGIKFGLGGRKIKIVRRLVEATASANGVNGRRLDCLPRAG
jgi:hypothetical protein